METVKMKNIIIPNYAQLIEYTFKAIKELGGSGKNTDYLEVQKVSERLPKNQTNHKHKNLVTVIAAKVVTMSLCLLPYSQHLQQCLAYSKYTINISTTRVTNERNHKSYRSFHASTVLSQALSFLPTHLLQHLPTFIAISNFTLEKIKMIVDLRPFKSHL